MAQHGGLEPNQWGLQRAALAGICVLIKKLPGTQMGPLVLIGSSGLVIGGVGSLQKFCRSVGFYRYTVYTYRKALNDSLTN